ncbi:MAG: hypothetical protein JNM62_11220 [Flavobacteriales bacterium]|nr:hypothetical protein [Flavobacteriales bacterium]
MAKKIPVPKGKRPAGKTAAKKAKAIPTKKSKPAPSTKKGAPAKAMKKAAVKGKPVTKTSAPKKAAPPVKAAVKAILPKKSAPKAVPATSVTAPGKPAVKVAAAKPATTARATASAPAPAKAAPPAAKAAAPKAAPIVKKRPVKERVVMEFYLNSSPNALYELLSTPSGFSEWYCQDVDVRGDQYTFIWDGEREETTMIGRKAPEVIRFRRNDDDDPEAFFEFRVRIDAMTNEVCLVVTDHAWPTEVDETRNLWTSQIETLGRVLGA